MDGRGKLIAFSGIDCSGKSTQIALLIEEMKKQGIKPVYFWSRGGYTGPILALKNLFRKVLGKRLPKPGPSEGRKILFQKPYIRTLWLSLAIFDLILIYGVYFRLLIFTRKMVLADRYLWDTWIDFHMNFPESKFDQRVLWQFLRRVTPDPHKAFLFLIPVEESLHRSTLKNEPFPEKRSVLERRLALYTEVFPANTWQRIDCLKPVDYIHKKLLDLVFQP